MTQDEIIEMALDGITKVPTLTHGLMVKLVDVEAAIKEALAQEKDGTYIYASSLATAIWQKHYIKESPKFALLDTTEGVLTQIDNMTCGLVREKLAQPEHEPVAWKLMPKDATDSMLKAMDECSTEGYDERLYAGHAASVYMAAWDAYPDIIPQPKPVSHAVIAGALFDFMGWLTSRKVRIVLSSADEASPAVEAITEFAKMRNLSLDDAKVQDWNTTPPQRTWIEFWR